MKKQLSPIAGMIVVFVVSSMITHGLLALVRAYGATVSALVSLMYATGVAAGLGCVGLYRAYKKTSNSNYWFACVVCAVAAVSCLVFPQAA